MISFLVCAYREEGIIKECIEHILKLEGKKEILVGCDKKTARQLKGYSIRLIIEKRRMGKAKMLSKLMKKSNGDILIINDAEHYLFPDNALKKICEYFKDNKIGGLTFNTFIQEQEVNRGYWVIVESIMWEIARLYNLTNEKNRMQFVNVFRKGIVDVETINDDAEIAKELTNKNYSIKTVPDVMFYGGKTNASSISDSINQKIRTQYGWIQMRKKYGTNMFPYYLKMFLFYMAIIFGTFVYIGIFIYSMIRALMIKDKSTSSIWKKRKR